MSERNGGGRSGGVTNFGTMNTGGGDVTGRDKVVGLPSPTELENALRPLRDVVRVAPAESKAEAEVKLDALEKQVAKGSNADDDAVADLVDGLVELVPTAASTVVSIFATPLLSGIAGSATKFVLRKLRGK